MKALPINFFKEGITFRLPQKAQLQKWIAAVIKSKGFSLVQINYIFCKDAHLLKMNKEYLNHNTYTDIITFPARTKRVRSGGNNSSEKKKVEADIFISYERVKINAANYNVPLNDELNRVMIHGVLHLLGYKDKSAKDKKLMRQMEDKMLALK